MSATAIRAPAADAISLDVVRRFALHDRGVDIPVAFACSGLALARLEDDADRILSATEADRLGAIASVRRRTSFLRGRHAAKAAVAGLRGHGDMRRIGIEPGVFDHPVVIGASGLGVTLSHDDRVAVALAFPDTYPLGIDIETVAARNEAALRTQMAERELAAFVSGSAHPVAQLTLLWSMKEALAKVLRGGLAIDSAVMCLSELRQDGDCTYGRFAHFGHVAAAACSDGDVVLSVAMSERCTIDPRPLFAWARACASPEDRP